MKTLLRSIVASPFIRAVTVLASGNLLAQIIPILMMPFFTRMYDASIFGIQALLIIGVNFMVPISTGFYEYAIPTPRSTRRARRLATIAFSLSAMVNLSLLIIIALLRPHIAALFHIEDIGPWVYAYPLIAFSVSLLNISNYWMLRRGKFHLQSLNKICQAGLIAILVMACGLMKLPYGLLAGFVLGFIVSGLFAFIQAFRQELRLDFTAARAYYTRLMRKYSEFPIFGSIPSSINNLAAQVPVIVITAHYSLSMTGHYSVVRNLMNAAMSLLAVCFGQVILKHFTDLIHTRAPLWPYYKRIAGLLLLVGVVAGAGTFLLGPWFFRLYLGAGWEDSVALVRIIAICMPFWLLGPALAHAAIAIKRLRVIALWQVLHGIMAFGLTYFSDLPFHVFIWRVVMYESFSYTLYFLIMTAAIRRYDLAKT